MKHYPYYLLGSIAFGGAIAKAVLENWIIAHYLGGRFDLVDVYRAGGNVGILGSGLAASWLMVSIQRHLAATVRAEAIALLLTQTGREDLPSGYRAAIAYVIEDLKEVKS